MLEGTKKVKIYDLSNPSDVEAYENLLNDAECNIVQEKFSFVGHKGVPTIVVWYEIEY